MPAAMRTLAIIILVYLAIYGVAILSQRSLLYLPDASRPDPAFWPMPGVQVVEIETSDGLTLESWFQPPSRDGMPTVLLFHGNGGNHAWRTHSMRPLADRGYGVLLASYRGYGGNPGKPSEEGLYSDARAHLDWLVKKAKTPLEGIILYGESLGSGPAIQMASEQDVAALILQTPYDSIAGLAQIHFFYFPFIRHVVWDKFENDRKIGALTLPTLILLAANDTVIPALSSERLIKAATEPLEVVTLKGAGHNSMQANGRTAEILKFLESYNLAP